VPCQKGPQELSLLKGQQTDQGCFGLNGRSVDEKSAVFLARPDLHLPGLLVQQDGGVLVVDAV